MASSSAEREARERISPYLSTTPLVPVNALPGRSGQGVFLKLENLQPTGSFKVRAAFNGLLSQEDKARARGVLASSSGNFAQAVAHAARTLSCSARIVMTRTTSAYKIARTRALGAEVALSGPSFKERWDLTYRLQEESGRVLLHPYDSEETLAGNGTLALELLEQLPGDFTVLVPVSGGGLLAGIARTLKAERPGCRIFGVQPRQNASLKKSLAAGRRVEVTAFSSIADALVAVTPGLLGFEIAQACVEDILLVEEEQIVQALGILVREQKLVAEPAGAIALAALLSRRREDFHDTVVCILSGGNAELETLTRLTAGSANFPGFPSDETKGASP